MEYAFLLWPHANTRYVASLRKLAYQELHCMLRSCGIPAEISWKDLGGAPWLHVSCTSLPSSALRLISGHSSIYMGATLESGLLRPLEYKVPDYLPPDMPEVLKYKGKTNASFTGLMFNCALCASEFVQAQEPLFIMDPMCGKATGLFCAITRGHNAIGIEIDGKDVKEAGHYISRYLPLHRIKHKVIQASMTLPGGKRRPFSSWTPRSSKASPEACASARVRSDTRISSVASAAMIRAATLTVTPRTSSPTSSTSPTCTPARTWSSSLFAARRIAAAQ